MLIVKSLTKDGEYVVNASCSGDYDVDDLVNRRLRFHHIGTVANMPNQKKCISVLTCIKW